MMCTMLTLVLDDSSVGLSQPRRAAYRPEQTFAQRGVSAAVGPHGGAAGAIREMVGDTVLGALPREDIPYKLGG
jgi:hypothetical protein